MTNQQLFSPYLIYPENQSFLMGKASLPARLAFPRDISGNHELIIMIGQLVIIFAPFLLANSLINIANQSDNLDKAGFFMSLGNLLILLSFINGIFSLGKGLPISLFRLFQITYERWLAKRILSKGGRIIEGWIYDVRFINYPESATETEILFELPISAEHSIEGRSVHIFGFDKSPSRGNELKFLYFNNQCYFLL